MMINPAPVETCGVCREPFSRERWITVIDRGASCFLHAHPLCSLRAASEVLLSKDATPRQIEFALCALEIYVAMRRAEAKEAV
jgi:hypothetical protein